MTATIPHDPLLLILAGLALDALLGEALFARIPHPVVFAGRAIAFFDRKLNRETRSEGARRVRGVITVILCVGAAAALGALAAAILRGSLLGTAVEILLIATFVAQKSLFEHVAAVGVALQEGGLEAGREAVRHVVGRDPTSLDRHAVARAAIESLAENFSDGVVAPVFFYLLLGLPGLFAYKMANTLDSMIGHATARYRSFGWAAARFDDLLNLVPARLSALLLTAAAIFLRGAHPGRAFKIMLRDGRKHQSPNAGWPEAAMAGALALSLAGPRRYAWGVVRDPWLGEGTARAAVADIARALNLYRLACLVEAGLIAGAWLLLHLPMPL
jgi:adenosylcobinamide-phosphate synthase